MATAFPNSSGHLKHVNMPCHAAKKLEWAEELDREFNVLNWAPNFPDLTLINHLRDVLDRPIHGGPSSQL